MVLDLLSTVVGAYAGASGTLVLQALAARVTAGKVTSSLIKMSKKTKFTEQVGLKILKGVNKARELFDAGTNSPSLPQPIPATRTSFLDPSGPVSPLPSLHPIAKSSLPPVDPVSLLTAIRITFFLALVFSLSALCFVAWTNLQPIERKWKRGSQSDEEGSEYDTCSEGEASTKDTLTTELETRIAELERKLAHQTTQNVKLSRCLRDYVSAEELALLVTQDSTMSISPAPEIERHESSESLLEKFVDCQETWNSLGSTTAADEQPQEEQLQDEQPQDNHAQPATTQPTGQGPTPKLGRRARWRAKKRDQKAAEKAALESSSKDHQS
ncbi:MAG: hypothetical protein Q9167_006996 [Letrouitia subvulpina]